MMDEPLFLGDWWPPDPSDDFENWILHVEDPNPPLPDPDQVPEPFLLAVESGNLREVQKLLAHGLSPNLRDGSMPLLSMTKFMNECFDLACTL
jgi:hypothetical protein